MARKIPITSFAPAAREPIEVVCRQASSFEPTSLAQTLRRPTLNYLFILNSRRQIVMASENVVELVPDKMPDQIIGLRLGEALGCIHARDCESGCGTGPYCGQCTAVRATLQGLDGHRELEKCRLIRAVNGRGQNLNLRILASPIIHENGRYTLLTVAVISSPNDDRD